MNKHKYIIENKTVIPGIAEQALKQTMLENK